MGVGVTTPPSKCVKDSELFRHFSSSLIVNWAYLRFNQAGNVRESAHPCCRTTDCIGHHSWHAGRSDTVTVSQTLIYSTEPTAKCFFMTLTAAALADSASRLRPVNRTQAEIRLNQMAQWEQTVPHMQQTLSWLKAFLSIMGLIRGGNLV